MLVGDFAGTGAGSEAGVTAAAGERASPGAAGIGSESAAGTSTGAARAGVWSETIVG